MKRMLTGGCVFALLLLGSTCLTLQAVSQSGEIARSSGSGQGTAKEFKFDVVSVRPAPADTFRGPGPTPDGYSVVAPLERLILLVYTPGLFMGMNQSNPARVVGLPNWNVNYEINARIAEQDIPVWQHQIADRAQPLLKSAMKAILTDRFKLVIHEQPVVIPVYDLVVLRGGAKLTPSIPGVPPPSGAGKLEDGAAVVQDKLAPGRPISFYRATIMDLVDWIRAGSDRPIEDRTGLSGLYDLTLYFGSDRPNPEDSLDRYQLDRLGLALKPAKGQGTNIVIDHIEKPSAN